MMDVRKKKSTEKVKNGSQKKNEKIEEAGKLIHEYAEI